MEEQGEWGGWNEKPKNMYVSRIILGISLRFI
jgi:hypothetical protein